MMANIPAASAANKTRFRIAAIAAGLLAAGLAGLHAQPITVPNFSFESQLAPNTSPFVNINIDSWQKIAEPSFYTPAFGSSGVPWVGTAGVFFDTNPYPNKDGNQLGYILAVPQVTLFQTLSATFQAGESYNVTLGVFGKPSVAPGSTLELSLYYLDNLNNEVTVGSTTITYSAGAFSVTNLVDFTASTAQIDPNSQAAGKNIGIQIESTVPIENTSFGNWDFDNVRLNAVPEPASVSLLAVGLGGWLLARARRRA